MSTTQAPTGVPGRCPDRSGRARRLGHLPATPDDRARLLPRIDHRAARQGVGRCGQGLPEGHAALQVDGKAGPRTLAAMGIWSGITSGNGRFTGPGPFPAPVQDEPFWNLTAEGIPYYNKGTACTASEAAVIAAEFANDGADAATQQWAVYIASREGGCRYDAVNLNLRTKDDSHCTFQLNVLSGMFEPNGALGRRGWTADLVKSSLQACADGASDLWVFCGRGPWTAAVLVHPAVGRLDHRPARPQPADHHDDRAADPIRRCRSSRPPSRRPACRRSLRQRVRRSATRSPPSPPRRRLPPRRPRRPSPAEVSARRPGDRGGR